MSGFDAFLRTTHNKIPMNINEIILDRRPWGRAFGLLMSCAVMLIGMARSVAPAEIVLRAATAAAISAICVRAFVRVLQAMADPGPDGDTG